MMQFIGAIARLIAEGNVFMLVNVGVLVLSLAVAAERMVVVVFRMRVDEKGFLEAIEKSLSASNPGLQLQGALGRLHAAKATATGAAPSAAVRG